MTESRSFPGFASAARSARYLASSPPVAILRASVHGAPSTQHLSYRTCYEVHVVAARAIDAARVLPCTLDARAVLPGVRVGLDAALRDRAAVERHLPFVPVAQVLTVADVARGLVYASETPAASGDRDRLWTLLVTRYAFARKVGWYFHGERCDEVVPPLGARVAACDDLDDETEPA